MNKVAIFGFTPREEVMVNTIRRDMPQAEIALFSGIPNRALEQRVDHVHGTSDADLTFLKEWGPEVVVIGPDKFSSLGIHERLAAAGLQAVGADSEQIKFETDRASLRVALPELLRHFPIHQVFERWDPESIRSCLREFGRYAVKYNGVYDQIGGGTKLSGLHLHDEEDALRFAQQSIAESGRVVIEQMVNGIDFSVNAISAQDGSIFFFPENYCYKLRDEGNLGPNTSGTGSVAYASRLPFMSASQQSFARDICREIIERVNHKGPSPLVSGLNLDFRLGDDGKVYLFEMNTRFAGSGTLSTVMDLTENPLLELLDRAARGSFRDVTAISRAESAVGVFTYPKFFPNDPDSEVRVEIPKASAVGPQVNCFTGWVQVLDETVTTRNVILKNSTTQLFQTVGTSPEECRGLLFPLLTNMSEFLEYRRDVGDMGAAFLQPMQRSVQILDAGDFNYQPAGRSIEQRP